MFRGSFVAFSWSKNGALRFEYFNYIRVRIFLYLYLEVEVIFTSLHSLHLKSVALFAIIIFRLQRSKMECLNKWNLCWGDAVSNVAFDLHTGILFIFTNNIFKVYVFCRFGRMFR